jgi:hypothetical protein
MPARSCSPSVVRPPLLPPPLPPKSIPLSFHTFHDLYTNKMSVTQTFHLAHRARGKLSSEAARSNHNLRILVGQSTQALHSLTLRLPLSKVLTFSVYRPCKPTGFFDATSC